MARGDGSRGARVALVAGASGLVGQALLPLLLARDEYRQVHSLVRRESGNIHVKLRENVVDFGALGTLPQADDIYISLGTTMKKAGSKEAFRLVDFDYVVGVAKAAHASGATRIAVVSSVGASPQSNVFYSRVKGEAEEAIAAIDYERVVLLRPSILDGEREEKRPGERIGLAMANALSFMVPKKYRAVHVDDVAEAMYTSILDYALVDHPRVRIIESDEIRRGL